MTQFREADLFPPLKRWLEDGGYTVHAEVNHCDIAARKGDELVIVEMKRAINLDLLLQAVRRQRTHASVYVAVPRPAAENKRWRELTRLLKRLELGLLTVILDSVHPRVELRFHPLEFVRQRDSRATRALLTEMGNRTLNLNVGGSTRRQVMTAYRERALAVAVAVAEIGQAAPRDVRRLGTNAKTGRYALANAGRQAIAQHAELAEALRKKSGASTPPPQK